MKITVCGAAGRMGQAIISLVKIDETVQIAGALEYEGSAAIGTGNPVIESSCELEKYLPQSDVLIDFTNPDGALKNLAFAKKLNKPVVIGTTGFIAEQKDQIAEIAKSIPVVMSPNMSVGVNILFKLVDEVARLIPDYDIEIVELHHSKKKDAPSGTAAKLSEIAATATGQNINTVGVYGRKTVMGERKKDEIGVLSVRAGDIVGDHTVYFAGPGERIELVHRAHSRDTFAAGSIRAAKWLMGKEPGLYDMQDVLGIKKI
ncbi:MAG: 4-hydroxy-tetrahydrodipicolinate reductase [Endomicrobium sp.]|jgi:4-hydroxy-tetrahydrodipicolinate reductase|nr:4-hydroxy-tetrahydrodipicolinate reductase [Endomicrobium sp.]